jgi:hypothetical protein
MEIHVWGTLNGESVDVSGAATGHATMTSTTSVSGDPLRVTLESAGLWQSGGTETCKGSVTGMDLGTVGNCLTDSFSGERTVDQDGDGATFHLTGLTEEDPASQEYTLERFCGGTAVTGELYGCFRF